eukprot:scaffold14123_cov17-Tisochrysis_lutea.AAC.1
MVPMSGPAHAYAPRGGVSRGRMHKASANTRFNVSPAYTACTQVARSGQCGLPHGSKSGSGWGCVDPTTGKGFEGAAVAAA